MADFDAVREQVIAESRYVTHVDGLVQASMTATVRAVTDAVRNLHQPAPVYLFDDECDCPDTDLHEVMELSIGEVVCLDSPTGERYCAGCSDDQEGEWTPYPCPTVRLCDEIDKAAGVDRG